MTRFARRLLVFAWTTLLAVGCDHQGVVLEPPPPVFPPFLPPEPVDTSVQQRELGRLLFFEKALSGDRTMACSSCHVVFLQATEPLALSIGNGAIGVGPTRSDELGAVTLARNTPDLFFRSQFEVRSMFWDGRLEDLGSGVFRAPIPIPFGVGSLPEIQVLMPLVDKDEMLGVASQTGNDIAQFASNDPQLAWSMYMSRLMMIQGYPELFVQAFPERGLFQHDISHVARAVVAFERALWERFDSAHDLGLFAPQSQALGLDEDLAIEGRTLFFGDAGCARCHGNALFSDQSFHNIGVPQFGPGKDPVSGLDFGRFAVTGLNADRFRFRTPMLRNCALTAPYMHNGAFPDLESAIRHHLDPEASLRGYTGDSLPPELAATIVTDEATLDGIANTIDPFTTPNRALTDHEVLALVEFLKSLTSVIEADLTPESGVPLSVPSGIPIDAWPGGPHPSRLENFGH